MLFHTLFLTSAIASTTNLTKYDKFVAQQDALRELEDASIEYNRAVLLHAQALDALRISNRDWRAMESFMKLDVQWSSIHQELASALSTYLNSVDILSK